MSAGGGWERPFRGTCFLSRHRKQVAGGTFSKYFRFFRLRAQIAGPFRLAAANPCGEWVFVL